MALAGFRIANVLAVAATVLSRASQIDFGELLLVLEALLLAELGRARREQLLPPLERDWHQTESAVRSHAFFILVFRVRI